MYNVLSKKIKLDHSIIKNILMETITNFEVKEIGVSSILLALDIRERYLYSYWDSLVIASCIENGCSILFSEDLQHNMVIEDKLRIINPYF